ncbi:hypothetical protein [Paracoccus yeei]|uniref:hypothetical protein n=1 Tax=Paracoccus yeei TaxID=147645 RepID=UPI003BF8F4FE
MNESREESKVIHGYWGASVGEEARIEAGDLKHGGGGGTFDDMEHRVTRLEEAFIRMDGSLSDIKSSQARSEMKLDHLSSDFTGVKVSQARIEERMERVMDKARDMPNERSVNTMLNHKLTILGVVVAVVVALGKLFGIA